MQLLLILTGGTLNEGELALCEKNPIDTDWDGDTTPVKGEIISSKIIKGWTPESYEQTKPGISLFLYGVGCKYDYEVIEVKWVLYGFKNVKQLTLRQIGE